MDTMLDFSGKEENQGKNEVYVAQRAIAIEPDGSATALFWGVGAAGVAVLVWMVAKRPLDAELMPNLLAGLGALLPFALLFWRKKRTVSHFQALLQKINGLASEIDNYIDQQIDILNNVAPLVEKSIDLDKDVMKSVAAFRGGVDITNENRNAVAGQVSAAYRALVPHVEAYPDLKAHAVAQRGQMVFWGMEVDCRRRQSEVVEGSRMRGWGWRLWATGRFERIDRFDGFEKRREGSGMEGRRWWG